MSSQKTAAGHADTQHHCGNNTFQKEKQEDTKGKGDIERSKI